MEFSLLKYFTGPGKKKQSASSDNICPLHSSSSGVIWAWLQLLRVRKIIDCVQVEWRWDSTEICRVNPAYMASGIENQFIYRLSQNFQYGGRA